MHRSGTSMVSHILEASGLFMGINKDKNNEPFYFINLNDWLLFQAGATWDNPQSFIDVSGNKHTALLLSEFLNNTVTYSTTLNFLGWRRMIPTWNLKQLKFAWGWKDPRNTLTLPLWLQVFPQAKVIHIYRHGIDVAESLRQRSQQIYSVNSISYRKIYYLQSLFTKQIIIKDYRRFDPVSLLALDKAFALWEFYIERGFSYSERLGNQIYHIKYEDILEKPFDAMKDLLNFCEFDIDEAKLHQLTKSINTDRAYAYRRSEELVEFADSVQGTLMRFGY